MGNLSLNASEFHDSYEVLNNTVNSDVVGKITDLARVLKPMEGDNELVAQAVTAATKFASDYNEGFYPSLVGLKKTFDELYNLTEYLEKQANLGDISHADSSFKSGTIDGASVMV